MPNILTFINKQKNIYTTCFENLGKCHSPSTLNKYFEFVMLTLRQWHPEARLPPTLARSIDKFLQEVGVQHKNMQF